MRRILSGHVQQIKAVQHNGIHIVQDGRIAGNHNALRLDAVGHICQPCAGCFLEVHLQFQLLGNIYRQRCLNLSRFGVDVGGVHDLTVRIVELIIQLRRHRFLGVFPDVKNDLGIADGVDVLFLSPDGNGRLRQLNLTGRIALRHVAGQLAAKLHLLVAQLADVHRGHIDALSVNGGIGLVEFPIRIGCGDIDRLNPSGGNAGEIRRHPDLGAVQLHNVPPFSLKGNIHGGVRAAVLPLQQHQPVIRKGCLIGVLDGNVRHGDADGAIAVFIHIKPDTGSHHNGQNQVKEIPQIPILTHPLHLHPSCSSELPAS